MSTYTQREVGGLFELTESTLAELKSSRSIIMMTCHRLLYPKKLDHLQYPQCLGRHVDLSVSRRYQPIGLIAMGVSLGSLF